MFIISLTNFWISILLGAVLHLSPVFTVLSSIKYNDKVIEDRVGSDKMTMQEERFNIFDSNIENDNFLKYESEYGTYKESTDVGKDNDIVDVDETIE